MPSPPLRALLVAQSSLRSRVMRRSIQINLDTGKKSVSRPIPSWLGHQRKTSIFVSLGVRDPSDSDSLRALDRCRGERRREHARHYGSLAPSSLGDYLCSSDQTWESESKEKLRFLNFFLHFPWTLFMSLRPRLFVVSRRHPSRLLDHGNRPRGLRPEGNEEGGLLHWNKSYTKDSGVVTQKFDSARNSIVTSWPVVTSLCVKSRSSSFPLSPLILHRPIRHQDPNQPLSRLVTPSYIRP